MGQNFHICLRSGLWWLTPSPPLTVSLSVKYPGFFDAFPMALKWYPKEEGASFSFIFMLLRGIIFDQKENGQNIKSFMSRCPTRWKYLIQDSSKSPSTGARLLTRNLESVIQSNFYGGEWNFSEGKIKWIYEDWIISDEYPFDWIVQKRKCRKLSCLPLSEKDKGKSKSCLIKIGRAWSHPTLSIHHDPKPPSSLSSREIVLLGLAGLVCSLLLLLTTPI